MEQLRQIAELMASRLVRCCCEEHGVGNIDGLPIRECDYCQDVVAFRIWFDWNRANPGSRA